MKYKVLKEAMSIKIDKNLLDRINTNGISDFARRRIEFLYSLNAEQEKAIRLNSIININSLIDDYSLGRINRYTPKQITRLLHLLLDEKTTYSEFIFSKKINNKNSVLKINKDEILEKVVNLMNKIKLFNVDTKNITQRELSLLLHDRKISFQFVYEALNLQNLISKSTIINYAAENNVKSTFSRRRKQQKIKNEKNKKFQSLYQKLNKTFVHNKIVSNEEYKQQFNEELKKAIQNLETLFSLSKDAKPIKKQLAKHYWGQIVEIDACQHRWFGNKQNHLYIAVDKSTGVVLAYHIEKEETTKGYVILLTKLFKTYGVPKFILTDKRTTFWKCKNDGTTNTPLMKCLSSLGCTLLSNSNPNFKPIVEGTFGILQNNLIAKACLKEITNLEDYIPFFENEIEQYNSKKLIKKSKEKNYFETVSDHRLEASMINRFKRTITFGLTVLIDNKHYVLEKNAWKCAFRNPGRTVYIEESFFDQGKYWFKYGSSKIFLSEITEEYDETKYIADLNKYKEKWKKKNVNY